MENQLLNWVVHDLTDNIKQLMFEELQEKIYNI